MTFLPIVERELRVAARRRATYWNRLGVALVGLIIGGWIMLFPGMRSPQILGMALFYGLAVVSFFYSGFAGVLSTADSLSEEKREGTLGLLFLTDLKGYDIVFGKLAAKSLNTFYGMLAIFPVMAIPLMAGGVSGTEFWRVVLVCLNNLFFSMALGLFCSAISRDERKAIVLAVLLLLFFAAGLPLLAAILENWTRDRELILGFLIPSPGYACVMAFESNFRGGAQWNFFYVSVIVVNLLSWLLLVVSTLIVPRTWHEKDVRPARNQSTSLWRQFLHGSAAARRAVRERLLSRNAFYWLTGRSRAKSLLVWLVLGIGGLIWALGIIFNPRDWLEQAPYFITAYLAHTILKFWVTFEACRQLADDRRSGALELLLVTPIRVKEILHGQMRALMKQFGGPVLLVLFVDCLFLMSKSRDDDWVTLMGSLMAVFVADLVALSWVGMWQALRGRNVNRAVGATIVRILVLPWVIYAVFLTLVALDAINARRSGSERFVMVMAPIIALVIDVFFGFASLFRLKSAFRVAASERRRSRRSAQPTIA